MSSKRTFKCNSCGEKFKSNFSLQQYFGQVDENGYLLVGVGICPDCYKLEPSFKHIFEVNLENAIKSEKENEEFIKKELQEEGY